MSFSTPTPQGQPPEVENLIQRALRGDQQAYQALFERFGAGVYRLCYSLLLHQQDAEDVTQDAFVYAFKNLQRYDPSKAAFKTWLYQIAVSRSRNQHRRQRPPAVDISQLMTLEAASPQESPEAAFARQEVREKVQAALSALSPRLREAIVLRYGHGLTYREMADVMACPPKTAESRVRLAHERLRQVLHQVGPALLDEILRF